MNATLRLEYLIGGTWHIHSTNPETPVETVDSFEHGLQRLTERADSAAISVVVAHVNGD